MVDLFDETIEDNIPVIDVVKEKVWEKCENLPLHYKLTDNIQLVQIECCNYGKQYDFPETDDPDAHRGIKFEFHEDKWELQIKNAPTNNQKHTILNDYTLKDLWDKFKVDIARYCNLSQEETKKAKYELFSKDTGQPLYKSAAAEFCEVKARRIFASGKAFEYMVYCCNKQHIGNTHIIKAMILSYANTRVINSTCNINLGIFSNAHAGKTHVKDTVKQCLPLHALDDSTKSDKALFYDTTLTPGTILVQDDQTLNEEKQNILKNLKPAEAQIHKTVKNQELLVNEIPENCPYWIIKVETQGDEQILDRQLNLWCDDETPEYQRARREMQIKMWGKNRKTRTEHATNSKTCRAIWDSIRNDEVHIPFADRIEGNLGEPRTLNLLGQLICASALMHMPKRDRDLEDNYIIATEEDFNIAADIINPLLSNKKGSQLLGLSKTQIKVIEALERLGTGNHTNSMIIGECGISESSLSKALRGMKPESLDGLLKICPAITQASNSSDISATDNRRTDNTKVSRKSYDWNSEAYRKWIGRYEPFTLRDPKR